MAVDESVSNWINAVRNGDEVAAAALWNRYFAGVTRLAARKLAAPARFGSDAEDVALSTLDAVFRGLRQGHYEKLRNRFELWQLMVTITTRKSLDRVRRERAQKRGGDADATETSLASLPSLEIPPDMRALMEDEFQSLIDKLDDADLKSVAIWKLDGFTNDEIAVKLNRSVWTVFRMLRVIRTVWQDEFAHLSTG